MEKNLIRIIPKLDIKNGLLIKGINLEGLRILGSPYNYAKSYYNQGADEIIYLDNVATLYGTNNLKKFVKETAKNLFIPLTVGGGIKSLEEIEKMLNNGADRVTINSSAIDDINFIKKASKRFGSSTIISSIEYTKIKNKHFITKSNGRDLVNIDPYIWAKKLEDFGSGEIILTSINQEGTQSGFDISMINKISKNVKIPVIAHGGAGNFKDVYDVIQKTNVRGVAIASLFHYNNIIKGNFKNIKVGNTLYLENAKIENKKISIIKKLKLFLKKRGVNVNL
jgi:cyclase